MVVFWQQPLISFVIQKSLFPKITIAVKYRCMIMITYVGCLIKWYNEYLPIKDAEHQLNLEISENETRKDFSKAERIDYARRLERIESLKAEKRMKAGKADPTKNSSEGEELMIQLLRN